MSDLGEADFEVYRAGVLRDLAAVLSVPVERTGRRSHPEMPCYCGPETRAAHTHARDCPRWIRASDYDT